MDKKRFLIGIGLILLLATEVIAEDHSIPLFFKAGKVNPEIKAIEKNGAKYVNLPFLGKYLHVFTNWDPSEGTIYLRFGKFSFKLEEGNSKYTVNGGPRKLSVAPFESEGQLWIPVELLLKLGLTVKSGDPNCLNLDWDDNYLIGIESIKYQERPAILLISTGPFTVNSFLLTGPDRLVIDLSGIKAHFVLDGGIAENPIVKKIRFNQYHTDTVRIVFDLNKLTGYKLVRNPEQENQLTVVFNYFVEEVKLFEKDEERKVYIKSSFPAEYQVKYYYEPYRLTIDLEGATLAGTNAPIAGDGKWLTSVRMSQFNPQTVRVVLDLNGTTPCFVLRSREDPTLIEVRTVQYVNQISWLKEEQGSKLMIEGTGELVESIWKQKNPEQLQIALEYMQFAPGLKTPDFKNEQIKGMRLITESADAVRMEVDLSYYMGYDTEISPDRRRLMISFKRSPIVGKTFVLDPGHGGVDMGACGRQGTREKDINLETVMRLKDMLEEGGAKVVLTRCDDTFISLYERPFISNYLSADLFISIHTNYHLDLNVRGIEVYHFPGRTESKSLATTVLAELIRYTGLSRLGIKTNDFVVIRETQMPSILVELGYLSNFQEESTIKTTEFRVKAAHGVFQGIIRYYQPKN